MNRTRIEWTDRELGFLEGLIDGEGSISLIKEKRPHFTAGVTYKPRLDIGNTCLALLEHAQAILTFGCIATNHNHPNGPFYCLDISANGIRALLPSLRLIVKERQRVLILKACQIHEKRTGRGFGPRSAEDSQQLHEIYLEIRRLNGRKWNKLAENED